MFERFTERARQVVTGAQDFARERGDDEIDDDHLLVGLLREEGGLAAQVLRALGTKEANVIAAIHERRGAGSHSWQTNEAIPFTQSAKTVLELGLREALSYGLNYIGTEHLLLGLARREGKGAALLSVGYEGVRQEVVRLLVGPTPKEERKPRPPEEELFAHFKERLLPEVAELVRRVADVIEGKSK